MNSSHRTLKQFLTASAGAGGLRILGLLFAMVLQVLGARLLNDTAAYGEFAWLNSLLLLVGALLGFGMPLAAGRVVARASLRPGDGQFIAIQRWAERGILAAGAAVYLVACAMAFWQLGEREGAALPWLVIAATPLLAMLLLQQSLGQAMRQVFWGFGPLVLLRPVLTAVLILLLWWLLPSMFGVESMLFCTILSLLILLFLQRRSLRLGAVAFSSAPAPNEAGKWRRSAALFYIQRLATSIGEHGYTLMVGILVAPEAAALFFAAERLARLVAMPQQFNSWFLRPLLAVPAGSNAREAVVRLSRQASVVSLLTGLVIAAFVVLMGAVLLGLFGPEFVAAQQILLVLVCGHLVDLACGPVRDLLSMRAREQNLALLSLFSLLLQSVAVLLLVPAYGALGAAWAVALTLFLANLLGVFLVYRSTGVLTGVLSLFPVLEQR